MNPPSYQPLSSESTPNWTENNWSISLVQGKWGEHQSPIDAVHPMRILNLACEITESEIAVPLPADWVGAIYVLDGKARINEQPIEGRQIALVEEGTEESILLRCIEPSRILVLTGAVLNEPVFSHGPFVMNSIEELQRAIMDYHEGKMGTLEETTN